MKLMRTTRPAARRMRDDFDRLVEQILPEPFLGTPFFPIPEAQQAWLPPCDLTETEADFVLRVEAAGIPKENLDVKLVGDVVTISGKRERMEESRGETEIWQEREVGAFARSLRLPAPVVEKDVQATYHDGVLTVRMPKVVKAKEQRITIS